MELPIAAPNTNATSPIPWTTPFPFLHLPPELRNRVYTYLHASNTGPAAVGLTQACKQLQSEFRPLYWHGIRLFLSFKNVHTLISTFSDGTARPVTILQVVVSIGDHDVLCGAIDVFALMSAKAGNRGVRWKFELDRSTLQGCTFRASVEQLSVILIRITNHATRRLLDDVESATFTEISLRSLGSGRECFWEWRIGVKNGRGRLDRQMKEKMWEYCHFFAGRVLDSWGYYDFDMSAGMVRVGVERGSGRVVERYVGAQEGEEGWEGVAQVTKSSLGINRLVNSGEKREL
jgi:hypothetical protein